MAIAAQTLVTLEFPKIQAQLARYTAFSASRELALELLPSTVVAEVRQALALTSEARTLLDESPELSVGAAHDIRRAVQHAARGGVLDGTSLLEIADCVAAARVLRSRLLKLEAARFPLLVEQAGLIPLLPPLEETITHAIGDDGAVLDAASHRLAELRRDIRIAFNRLHEKLQNLISSSAYAGALQEPIITVRNGHYVVPVKASHRKDVRGLVHDQSSSGATLYIEPMVVVELNNRWRELQAAEEEEVQRILAALADQVGAPPPPPGGPRRAAAGRCGRTGGGARPGVRQGEVCRRAAGRRAGDQRGGGAGHGGGRARGRAVALHRGAPSAA